MEMEEKILAVLADFRKTGSIRKTAQNFSSSTGTVRKMLITSGEWNNKTSTDIAALRRLHSDWTKAKIAEHLQISLKTIEIYTPYEEYRSLSGPKHSNITADETVVETGDCGDKVTWILQKDGTLTISGIGPMWDYSGNCWGVWGKPRPKWWMRRDGVKVFRIIIKEGVTSIGGYAFADLTELKCITLPSSLSEIFGGAFCGENDLREIRIPEKVSLIRWDTFFLNIMLEEVHIPANVRSIQSHAFHGCKGLKRFFFYGDAPMLDPASFAKCAEDVVIYRRKDAKGFGDEWGGYRTELF